MEPLPPRRNPKERRQRMKAEGAALEGATEATPDVAPAVEEKPRTIEVDPRIFVVTSILILFGATWLTFRTPASVGARSLVLRDAEGRTRATIEMGRAGPGLALYDENGRARALLEVTESGPRLRMYDQNMKVRAQLAVDDEGSGLALWDEHERLSHTAP